MVILGSQHVHINTCKSVMLDIRAIQAIQKQLFFGEKPGLDLVLT
jgi:hypothetical protein